MKSGRRVVVMVALGVAALALLATTASARTRSLAGENLGNSTLIVGGARSFGSDLTTQLSGINPIITTSGGGGQANDYFRRAQFVRVSSTSDVPEPSSLWLLGSGLGALALVTRRKNPKR